MWEPWEYDHLVGTNLATILLVGCNMPNFGMIYEPIFEIIRGQPWEIKGFNGWKIGCNGDWHT